MQRWAIEWSGTAQLANNGITRDTLHVGDAVTIVGDELKAHPAHGARALRRVGEAHPAILPTGSGAPSGSI
jgi:hypothetical protein